MKVNTAGGKGSAPRQQHVSNEQFANNWDRIFGKKEKKEDSDDCCRCQNCTCGKKKE